MNERRNVGKLAVKIKLINCFASASSKAKKKRIMCCTYVGITHDKPRWGLEDIKIKQKQKDGDETVT